MSCSSKCLCDFTATLFRNPHAIKRPQAKSTMNAKKPLVVASRPTVGSSTPEDVPATFVQQYGINYYMNTIDDDVAINEARREAERARKQHKKENQKFQSKYGGWNSTDSYKIRKHTNLAAYKAAHLDGGGGYGYQNMVQEFNDYVRAERDKARRDQGNTEHTGESRPVSSSPSGSRPVSRSPPIPPAQHLGTETRPSSSPIAQADVAQTGEDAYLQRAGLQHQAPPVQAPIASTGSAPLTMEEETKQRIEKVKQQLEVAKERARQTAAALQPIPPPPPPPPQTAVEIVEVSTPPPPPPPPPAPYSATISAPPVRYNPTISAPPVRYSPTISGAPVHYPTPASDEPEKKEHATSGGGRPAKKQKTEEPPKPTKAELMMAKMGYVKGKGLGKNEDGVTTHLEVKVRKEEAGKGARQRIDPDEMDWTNDGSGKKTSNRSQAIFDITGGLRSQPQEKSKWGEPSRVVVTWGCVDGIDFSTDADRLDGGIRQEMGDVFKTKFGPVQQIHVNMSSSPKTVYILFADMMAALNAVNRFSEGFRFQGRLVRAEFYDQARFDQFDFEH